MVRWLIGVNLTLSYDNNFVKIFISAYIYTKKMKIDLKILQTSDCGIDS